MDLSVSQGICLKLQSSWGFVSKFTFPKLPLKSRSVLNSYFSCIQYLVIKFVVSGAPFCALLLVWAYHRSLATFTWVVKNNKSNRFFGTIYFWKQCSCPPSFSNSTDSCQKKRISKTSLLAFPIPRLPALSGGWPAPFSPKAGVTVSITVLSSLDRCLAEVTIPCRSLRVLPPPNPTCGSIPASSPQKDAVPQRELQE